MRGRFSQLRAWVMPPIPDSIRDDFACLRAERIKSQTPLLFLTLGATTPTAAYGAAPGVSWIIATGFPILMGFACLLGVLTLYRQRHLPVRPRRARRMVAESTWVSGTLAVMCSAWCVESWLAAPPETRIYYPMIMAMGSLATAFCLSSIRWATIVNLVIGILPMSVLMLGSGDRLNIAAGTSLLIATIFLMRMIVGQHHHLVALLELQRSTRLLATTDPLTGVSNRRGLDERMAELVAQVRSNTRFAVAMLDLNDFKSVNDRHGHAAGDALLCSVALRLRAAVDDRALVARLGGDEFAILLPHGSHPAPDSLAAHLLAALVPPHPVAGHHLTVGASVGVAVWPDDGRDAQSLYAVADRALYDAKPHASAQDAPWPSLATFPETRTGGRRASTNGT